MTTTGLRVIILAIFLFLWTECRQALGYELVQTENKDFSLHSGASLSLIVISGNIEVHSWGKEEVHLSMRKWVVADSRQQAEAEMMDLKVEYSQKEDFLEIQQLNREENSYLANLLRKTGLKKEITARIDFALFVPTRIQLRINQYKGKTSVDSLTGNVSVNQKNGVLELNFLSADILDLMLGDVQANLHDLRGETGVAATMTATLNQGNFILQDSQLGKLMVRAEEADCYLVNNRITNSDLENKEGDIFLNPIALQDSRYQTKTEKGDIFLILSAEPACSLFLETNFGMIQTLYDWQIEKNASGCFFDHQSGNPHSGRMEVTTDFGDIYIQKNWQTFGR